MRVLVACEFSGIVRDAFIARGHDAMSADLLPSERPGPHYQGDVLDVLDDGWDLAICHPPCTFMANSGAKHLYIGGRAENGPDPARWESMREGAAFFRQLWDAPIPRIAIENPVMVGHAKRLIGVQQAQTIQPWMFSHGEVKATCLWLKGLPPLIPTDVVDGRTPRVHHMSPGPDRWRERSRTFQGIADAMADQWGGLGA
jgi:hypothetical protein